MPNVHAYNAWIFTKNTWILPIFTKKILEFLPIFTKNTWILPIFTKNAWIFTNIYQKILEFLPIFAKNAEIFTNFYKKCLNIYQNAEEKMLIHLDFLPPFLSFWQSLMSKFDSFLNLLRSLKCQNCPYFICCAISLRKKLSSLFFTIFTQKNFNLHWIYC